MSENVRTYRLVLWRKEKRVWHEAVWLPASAIKSEISNDPHPIATNSGTQMLLSFTPASEGVGGQIRTHCREENVKASQDSSLYIVAPAQCLFKRYIRHNGGA
jgi:hypothetical protein